MKKIIVSIVAVAVMALAVGCGNSGSTQSTGVAKSSTSKSNVTSNKAQNAPSNAAVVKTHDAKSKKTTYTDFTEGDFSFSNITYEHHVDDPVNRFTLTMTYNGPGEIYVDRIEFKFYDEDGSYTRPQRAIEKTLAHGQSVEVDYSGSEEWTVERIEFMGQVKRQ